jgi:uncharacterized spore protein YtfJ
MPTFTDVLEQASSSIGAKRVFGEPYEKNGVTVIPAARIMGGVGGGEGEASPAADRTGDDASARRPSGGMGGGYGLSGGPAGAFVVKGDDVKWIPAIDVNRLMFGFQVVMVVFFLTIRSISRARAKAKS